MSIEQIYDEIQTYTAETLSKASISDWRALARITAALLETKQKNGRVLIAGNGGSLATGSHLANDLTKGCREYNRDGFVDE